MLDKLCDCCDNEDIEKQIVDNLFPEITGDFPGEIDELIAMLKVLGRPFLTFRREIKETVFKLMLTMLDALLQNISPKNETKLDRILTYLWKDSDNRTLMVGLLINRLTELGANYIIRKRSMLHILKYAEALSDNGGTLKSRSGFTNNYLNRIKQLVGQSNDFAKSLYLEYLLLYDEEYKDDYAEKNMVSLAEKTFLVTFKRKAYLENTKLLNYGVEALAACLEEKSRINSEQLKRVFDETYYLDNFLQYLAFHKMILADENGKFERFTSNSAVEKLKGMLRFQILYQKVIGKVNPDGTQGQAIEEQNLRDTYQEMLEDLRMASGALDAEIIVPYENKTNSSHFEKYIALEFGKGADVCGLVNNEKRLNEFIKNNWEFEGDTYTIIDETKRKWVLIKIYDAVERERGDNISVIYLLFPFDIIDEGEILHSVKNILVFREKILKMVNLSSSTLLQNWTNSLFYKQQMLKSRAVGHSELESLNKDIEELAEVICDKKEKPLLAQKYFERLVNDMIGFMNSRVLGGKGEDYLSGTNCTLEEFFKGDKKIFTVACELWNLEIKPKNKEKLFSKKIRAGRKKSAPELTVLRILVLAVLQNVQKHAMRQEDDKISIKLYEEEGKLCISNQVAESESSIIQEETSEEAYRSGEGISQAVIWDICDSWYGDIGFQETFSLKNDNGQWWYVVKLPILERKGKE